MTPNAPKIALTRSGRKMDMPAWILNAGAALILLCAVLAVSGCATVWGYVTNEETIYATDPNTGQPIRNALGMRVVVGKTKTKTPGRIVAQQQVLERQVATVARIQPMLPRLDSAEFMALSGPARNRYLDLVERQALYSVMDRMALALDPGPSPENEVAVAAMNLETADLRRRAAASTARWDFAKNTIAFGLGVYGVKSLAESGGDTYNAHVGDTRTAHTTGGGGATSFPLDGSNSNSASGGSSFDRIVINQGSGTAGLVTEPLERVFINSPTLEINASGAGVLNAEGVDKNIVTDGDIDGFEFDDRDGTGNEVGIAP